MERLANRTLYSKLIGPNDALVPVDVTPTFMPGGGLPVNEGDKIVPPLNWLIENWPNDHIYPTRDLHPYGHISLASSYLLEQADGTLAPAPAFTEVRGNDYEFIGRLRTKPHALFGIPHLETHLITVPGRTQTLWPDHGLFDTIESQMHPGLNSKRFRMIFPKGMKPQCDSYSAFTDCLDNPTGFGWLLYKAGVRRIFFTGLALDYCVGLTALDATKNFEVVVIKDLTRSVTPASEKNMLAQFSIDSKISIINLKDLLQI